MCETVKSFVLECIERARSDDFARASHSFKGFAPEQMQEQHGQSGKTRQQILDGYNSNEQKCDAARKAVNTLL